MFIGVSGKEPLKAHLVIDVLQEIYPDNEQYAQSLYKEWELSRSKSRNRPRYSSMDHVSNSTGANSIVTQRDMAHNTDGEEINLNQIRKFISTNNC